MKQLTLITHSQRTAVFYREQLQQIFNGHAEILSYSLDVGQLPFITSDAVLLSTHAIYELVETKLRACSNILFADLTLQKSAIDRLRALPPGTRAMLVNSTREMAVETITLISNSGLNHLSLIPVYPGLTPLPDIDLAITPGELQLVPTQAKRVIDLHDRILSARTITNLAAKLGLSALLQGEAFKAVFESQLQSDLGLERLYNQVHEQEQRLALILQVFDGAVMTFTENGICTYLNDSAKQLLEKGDASALGKHMDTLIPAVKDIRPLQNEAPLRNHIITINHQLMELSLYFLRASDLCAQLLLMRTVSEAEQEQYKMRRQLLAKGHTAKHSFHDIKTQNAAMQRLKQRAAVIAKSASSVVIYGESGTGKELFAQSIHNASPRRSQPFIAINCASIPENLLESELFGYNEGAFTGAKKGGKAGYFELAHRGTLFLDEISELALPLQSRLLRVLQEREVIRIGGDSVIDIDVRIITASNQRLLDLVKAGKFREDLYYRLNVLSLDLPPLKERREDISLLLEAIRKELGGNLRFTQDALHFLSEYPWHGNIRELRNFVERCCCLEKSNIDAEDAKSQLDPWNTLTQDKPEKTTPTCRSEAYLSRFLLQEAAHIPIHMEILTLLQENKALGLHQGRASILSVLQQKNIPVTEQEVRRSLSTLKAYGFVLTHIGRAGTELTASGANALQALQNQRSVR